MAVLLAVAMLTFESVLFVKWLDILPIGLTDENFVLADGAYEVGNVAISIRQQHTVSISRRYHINGCRVV